MTIAEQIRRYRIDYLLVFTLAFIEFGFLHWNFGFGDPDAFYHAKIAEFLSSGVVLETMPWMQFSTLTSGFTDHHFLYHLFLVPFLSFGKTFLALKLASIFLASSLITTIYWFLKKLGSEQPFFFTSLLLLSSGFVFRIVLVKAVSFSLIILIFFLYSVIQRKKLFVFLLSLLYVLSYGGWILSTGIAGLYWLLSLFFEKKKKFWQFWKTDVAASKIFGLTLLGNAFGILLHPNWPHNLYFYWLQVVQIGLVNYQEVVNVGSEWLGLNWQTFLASHLLVLLPLVAILLLQTKKLKRWPLEQWLFFSLAIIFSLMAFKSRRYLEISVPFSLIASAMAVKYTLPKLTWSEVKDFIFSNKITKLYSSLVIVLVLPLLLGYSLKNLLTNYQSIAYNSQFTYLKDVSLWLKDNAEVGEVVIPSDWDDWPALFYYNTNNYYIVGLDPTFLYLYNRELYNEYSDLTQGRSLDYYRAVSDFGGIYVIANNDHPRLQEKLNTDTQFRLVFEGQQAKVFKIQDD